MEKETRLDGKIEVTYTEDSNGMLIPQYEALVPIEELTLTPMEPPEPPEMANEFIGKYGMEREEYLKEYKNLEYRSLIMSNSLHRHLLETNSLVRERVRVLVEQMAKAEGVNEELKRTDMMRWVGLMNNLKACAEEIAYSELIYV